MRKAIIIGADAAGLAVARDMFYDGWWPIILEPTGSMAGQTCLSPLQSCSLVGDMVIFGELHLHMLIRTVFSVGGEICALHAINNVTGEMILFAGDYFFSSFPMAAYNSLSTRS